MLAPNRAGNLAIFRASCGSTRAKDIDLTAGTLCIELAPKGHCLRLPIEGLPSAWSRPPALLAALWCKRRCVVMPLRARGAHLEARTLPLITLEGQSSFTDSESLHRDLEDLVWIRRNGSFCVFGR